ncbi:MAG: methyltransferase domain-containing protein [Mycobacteriaceae bacterium]|nr:methyltransferase domain-containing protein [Mycobacteriaceae bacterium]
MDIARSATSHASTYALGHSDPEVQRLMLQARLYEAHTEQALRLAGLRPGMRVLDVGCGPGDVSFLAARLVGPAGSVLGVDAAADIVDRAKSRAAAQGVSNVSFTNSTITDFVADEPVDAVIGRLILMHLPDPVAALRHFATQVRPGGVVAFCENDISAVRSYPDIPLFHATTTAITSAFEHLGLNPRFGTTLNALFQRAGLGVPQMTLSAPIGGATDTDLLAYAADVWRLVLPVVEQLGLGIDELTDADTFLPLLEQLVAAEQATVMMPPLITAWAVRAHQSGDT